VMYGWPLPTRGTLTRRCRPTTRRPTTSNGDSTRLGRRRNHHVRLRSQRRLNQAFACGLNGVVPVCVLISSRLTSIATASADAAAASCTRTGARNASARNASARNASARNAHNHRGHSAITPKAACNQGMPLNIPENR